jgi:hypothetical protein
MIPKTTPRPPIIMALWINSEVRLMSMVGPSIIRQKYFGNLNFRMAHTIGEAENFKLIVLTVQQKKEPITALPRVGIGPAFAGHFIPFHASDIWSSFPRNVKENLSRRSPVH